MWDARTLALCRARLAYGLPMRETEVVAATRTPTISLDFRFADARVVSADYGSTITLLDYDLAIWNPASLLNAYTRGASDFQGLVSLSEAESFEIKRDVARRREEMIRFLGLGKTLVIVVYSPVTWCVDTGERKYSGTGRNRHTTNIVAKMDTHHAL